MKYGETADKRKPKKFLKKGNDFINLKRYEDAIKCYDEALKINPEDAFAWNNKGIALDNLGRYDEAIACYDEALKINPEDAFAWYNKGIALKRLERFDEAIKCYDEALKIDPEDADTWYNKGLILGDLGKREEELACYDKALAINPESHRAWNNKGIALKRLERFDEAIKCYDEALKINPEDADAWYNKGSALKRLERFDEAIKCYDEALKIDPNDALALENKKNTLDNLKRQGASNEHKQQIPPLRFFSHFPAELSMDYTDAKEIGKGGFARVFSATRTSDNKKVAVKIPISLDKHVGRSFIKEIENWTGLTHENIVSVYEYNILPIPYFEMELCDSSLKDIEKPLDVEKAAWILFNIAEGIKYAHDKGISHLDLKPHNILLKEGIPKISDWGLSRVTAKSTTTTLMSFSPMYATPEHFSRSKFGMKNHQTDIFQLGVIFYELVTGNLPFDGDDVTEISFKVICGEYPPLSDYTSDASNVEHIIDKCLEKKKSKRYQTIGEMQKDVAVFLNIVYREGLQKSQMESDLCKSIYFCRDLIIICLKIGEKEDACKYATSMLSYAHDTVKQELKNLISELEVLIEEKLEVETAFVKKAELILHKIIFSDKSE